MICSTFSLKAAAILLQLLNEQPIVWIFTFHKGPLNGSTWQNICTDQTGANRIKDAVCVSGPKFALRSNVVRSCSLWWAVSEKKRRAHSINVLIGSIWTGRGLWLVIRCVTRVTQLTSTTILFHRLTSASSYLRMRLFSGHKIIILR